MNEELDYLVLGNYSELNNQESYLIRADKEIPEKFIHRLIVKGFYVAHDFAQRWCWQEFGPRFGICGDCYSEYPACNKVLATKQVNKEGDVNYFNPGVHDHEGTWKYHLIIKTGYDYGFSIYAFCLEQDMLKFQTKLNCFDFGLGENYED